MTLCSTILLLWGITISLIGYAQQQGSLLISRHVHSRYFSDLSDKANGFNSKPDGRLGKALEQFQREEMKIKRKLAGLYSSKLRNFIA